MNRSRFLVPLPELKGEAMDFREVWGVFISSLKVTLASSRMVGWALVAAAVKRMDRATDGE